jgi:hypothetical protein
VRKIHHPQSLLVPLTTYREWEGRGRRKNQQRKKDSEKAEIFLKIEPYLIFLTVHQLERQEADIQSKVEQLEQLNQSMRDRDKMKDDAIAHLSDQLIALTTRLDSIERRQQ